MIILLYLLHFLLSTMARLNSGSVYPSSVFCSFERYSSTGEIVLLLLDLLLVNKQEDGEMLEIPSLEIPTTAAPELSEDEEIESLRSQ